MAIQGTTMDLLEKFKINLSHRYKWIILLLLVSSTLVGYIARMGVSVALPFISKDFGWSITQQGNLGGILLGIFLISYGFSNFFLSPYIDIYGPKRVLSVSIFTWSASLILGAGSGTLTVLLFSRVLLGLAQGVLFPVASKVVGVWFQSSERARANSVYMSGAPLGSMLSPLLLTPIIVRTSWELSFYFVAFLGFALIPPVLFLMRSAPGDGGESEERREVDLDIRKNIKTLLLNRQFQVILVGFTAMLSVWWGISLWLPTYLVEAQGVTISEMSYAASFPYIGAVLGLYLGSWISDVTGRRKELIVIALLSTTLMFLALTTLNIQSKIMALLLLFMVFFFGQLSTPLFFTLLQSRVSSGILGSATGIMNGIGNGVGVIGPVSVGFIASLTGSYDMGLMFLGAISLIGGLIFHCCYKISSGKG